MTIILPHTNKNIVSYFSQEASRVTMVYMNLFKIDNLSYQAISRRNVAPWALFLLAFAIFITTHSSNAASEPVTEQEIHQEIQRKLEERKAERDKRRIERAARRKAAAEEGIVPGGGVAFLRAVKTLEKIKLEDEDEQIGINILRRALEEPLRQIAQNAGHEGAIVVGKIRENKNPNFGFNAASEEFEDMVEAGVIDPTCACAPNAISSRSKGII